MSINKSIHSLLPISLLMVASTVSAHDYTGSLATAAGSTDYFAVNCSDDGSGAPYQLDVELTDTLANSVPTVSVQVTKDLMAATSSDLKDTDSIAGPVLTVKGGAAPAGQGTGAGNYFVQVDKNKAGLENYHLTYHCQTQNGTHTGTDITVLQNQ